MRKLVVILAVLLLPPALAPVQAATIHTSEFGTLGKIEKGRSGVPRAETNAATGRGRWGDGAETFTLGYTARRGANGTEAFMTSRVTEDDLGQVHVRLSQSIAGLKVVGADLIVHADAKTGNVLGVNGRFAVDRNLARHPEVEASAAIVRATRELGISGGSVQGAPELTYIVDGNDDVRLAWSNMVAYQGVEGAELDLVFADALTGAAITRHPQIKRAKNRAVYDCGGSTTVPCSTLVLSEGGSSMDATVTAAYNNAGIVYNYFSTNHSRDSYDGAGATIRLGVHYGSNYNNAGWVSSYYQIVFGDGNGTTYSSFPYSLDVVAHEFAHGVTHTTANLTYSGESGGIDEGLADVFAAATEIYSDGSINADVWKIGDEIYTPGTSGDAIRYLNDPALKSGQADYYPTRSFSSSDLHKNAGIPGLAFYLLTQGGQHPRGPASFFTTGQGITKAEKIFYRALAVYATSNETFRMLRADTLQAATDLYGLNSAPYTAMWNAWAAVGNNWDQNSSSVSSGGTWNGSSYTTSTSGYHTAHLFGPAGSNFDLYLDKWNGSTWAAVDWVTSASTNEVLASYQSSGQYRWRVVATSGSGTMNIYANRPQ